MRSLLLIALFAVAAGTAHGQTLAPSPSLSAAAPHSPAPATATPPVRLVLPAPYAEAYALKAAGIARTSVDRRVGPGEATGSLGLLCGRQPDVGMSGAAAASGYDPDGKFLGAKLSLAF